MDGLFMLVLFILLVAASVWCAWMDGAFGG